jgi:hypothetical protein
LATAGLGLPAGRRARHLEPLSFLLNDGGVLLGAGWLGDAWHLYFVQEASREVAVMSMFGPAWVARTVLDLGVSDYLTFTHPSLARMSLAYAMLGLLKFLARYYCAPAP